MSEHVVGIRVKADLNLPELAVLDSEEDRSVGVCATYLSMGVSYKAVKLFESKKSVPITSTNWNPMYLVTT